MSSNIKNIIVFVVIAVAMILAYIFFFKKAPNQTALTSYGSVLPATTDPASDPSFSIGQDFLAVLLNVKTIKLDDSIFLDPAFSTLIDSSIELVPDGNEGRPNPFAPLGSDLTATPINGQIAPLDMTGGSGFAPAKKTGQ